MILKREERETEGDEVKKKVKQLDGSHFHADKKKNRTEIKRTKQINKQSCQPNSKPNEW